jgi:hypothetical protein
MAQRKGLYYEILNQRIFDAIVNQDEVKTIDVQHDLKLQGKTTKHQIDVYWEFVKGKITYRNIVQTKDWGGPVSQGEMYKFKAVLDDLPNQPRGIFVSRNGYQKGALEVAEKNGILTYKLEIVFNDDKKSVAMGIMEWQFSLSDAGNYNLTVDGEWIKAECKKLDLPLPTLTQTKFYPKDMDFYDEAGNVVANLLKIAQSKYPQKPSRTAKKVHVHKFKKPTFLNSGNDKLPRYKVLSVKFTITTERHVNRAPIVGEPIVEFILENVLEDTRQRIDRQFKLVQ